MSSIRQIVVLALLPLCLPGTEPSIVHQFSGQRQERGVKLVWALQVWPAGWQGMTVKRRELGKENAEWVTLTKSPVAPKTFAALKLKTVVADAELRAELQKKFLKYRQSEKKVFFKPWLAPEAKAIEGRTADEREALVNQIAYGLHVDTDNAYFLGVGFFDAAIEKGKKYEYGLFPVFDGKDIPARPVARCTPFYDPDDARLLLSDLKLKKGFKGVRIKLSIPKPIVAEFDLRELAVFRKEADADKPEKLKATISLDDDGKGILTDCDADPRKKYVYEFAPVTWLGEELKRRTTAQYPREE